MHGIDPWWAYDIDPQASYPGIDSFGSLKIELIN